MHMKELNRKEERFYYKWEKRRKKKWLYIFLHGSVYWGFSVAIMSFLLNNRFSFENMQFTKLLISIIVFGVGGLGYGLWLFTTIDSTYLSLNDNDKIKKGIQEIKSGLTWSYENLKILQDESKALIVQNELFWFDDENVTPNELNECFKLIMDDYNRLQKDSDYYDFSKNKKTIIQVFNNSKEKPLMEMIMKNNSLSVPLHDE